MNSILIFSLKRLSPKRLSLKRFFADPVFPKKEFAESAGHHKIIYISIIIVTIIIFCDLFEIEEKNKFLISKLIFKIILKIKFSLFFRVLLVFFSVLVITGLCLKTIKTMIYIKYRFTARKDFDQISKISEMKLSLIYVNIISIIVNTFQNQ